MIVEAIIIVIALFLFIVGGFLFCGKGAWMIAGYNTASKEQKEKYDKKKLCRATSYICFVCGIMLCIMAYLGYRIRTGAVDEAIMYPFTMIFSAVLIASIIICIIYINTRAKNK